MSTDASNPMMHEPKALKARITSLEKERDFIKKFYGDMPQLLKVLSKSGPVNTLLDRFRLKLQAQLSQAYCLFVVCDKDCLQWRLQYSDATSEALLSENGELKQVPQSVVAFAATTSCPKRHEVDIQQSPSWSHWQPFFSEHGFKSASMVSVADGRDSIYIMLVFQRDGFLFESGLMELILDSYHTWIGAAFEREKADTLLLEDSHKDLETGLLRRYSFENSFEIILKDSRRHFLRTALLSIRLLASGKPDPAELKVLATVVAKTVRDNDLVARFDDDELVMGIRIQQLEDAEIVAMKLLDSLKKPEHASNSLMSAGVSIGIAYYPENSSLESLYQSAVMAAQSLKNISGYRLAFHNGLYETSKDIYV